MSGKIMGSTHVWTAPYAPPTIRAIPSSSVNGGVQFSTRRVRLSSTTRDPNTLFASSRLPTRVAKVESSRGGTDSRRAGR